MTMNDRIFEQHLNADPNCAPTIAMIPEESIKRWNANAKLESIRNTDPIVSLYLEADRDERNAIAKACETIAFDGTQSVQSFAGAAVTVGASRCRRRRSSGSASPFRIFPSSSPASSRASRKLRSG